MRSPDGDMSLPRNDIGRESGISRRARGDGKWVRWATTLEFAPPASVMRARHSAWRDIAWERFHIRAM